MRFFSSSALEKAAKFRLAASCSAAEAMFAPLRSGAGFRCLGRLGDLDASARLFDGGDGRARGAGYIERDRPRQLPAADDAHAVHGAPDHAGGRERHRVDRSRGIEAARLDRLLDAAERHFGVFVAEDIGEAALGQAPVQRHLAALEAIDGDAGARLLALDAAPGRLALAGADAAALALAVLQGARIVGKLVEFHWICPESLNRRVSSRR